jgi:uncharacterized membrane protein YccC
MKLKKIMTLVVSRENSSSLVHSARTTTAAVASLLVARLLRMPEGYWASITALIVMQSTFGAALSISAQRFIGTAVVPFWERWQRLTSNTTLQSMARLCF